MNTRSILAGTYEHKRPYQRNLAIGFGISGAVQIAIVLTFLTIFYLKPAPIEIHTSTPSQDSIIIIPPPIGGIIEPPQHINTGEKEIISTIGIPTPYPDDEVPIESDIPSQLELSLLAPNTPIEGIGEFAVINAEKIINEILPRMDTVIFYDEPPVQVNAIQPEYPEFARRTGIEGTLWLKVLIDKEGNVRDAIVAKSSNTDVGFEQAAIDAARLTVWRPAIANGMPIAVWVSYCVKFQLK